MEEQILQILIEVSKGEKSPELAYTEILGMLRSYGIVRWHDNEYEDVVCVDKATAEEYVRKYNEVAGTDKCFVDEDIWLPLNNAKLPIVGQSEQLKTDLENEVFNNDKDWATNDDVDEHFRSV